MNISYVLMQFPVPSETFAGVDIKALRRAGHVVNVYGMRPSHRMHRKLIEQRGLDGLYVENFSIRSFFQFLGFLFLHPIISLYLLNRVMRMRSRKHIAKSLVLYPSAISIFSSIYKDKPDVVHLFWGHYPSMVGTLVKKYMPDTTLTQFLGAHDLLEAYPLAESLAQSLPVIFTHAESNVSSLQRIGVDNNKIRVVHRGVDTVARTEDISRIYEGIEKPILVTASRLINEKGVDNVLGAFKLVSRVYPGAKLYIAGDGPSRAALESEARKLEIENDVDFLGHIDQRELIKLMKMSHFFVLMSRYRAERLPNVIKEAMLQGCVVVSTVTDGVTELVKHSDNGFLNFSGTPEETANCIFDCINKALHLFWWVTLYFSVIFAHHRPGKLG
ncbi:glycosyltransferase family 4 protein, partial [Halopseudomonas xiamenensis]|uniref:glycosyltransferase family 4 protein n=1 Tax=Halopseudomonas xiamenensis TaxID=157792 RepID=UPI00162510AC